MGRRHARLLRKKTGSGAWDKQSWRTVSWYFLRSRKKLCYWHFLSWDPVYFLALGFHRLNLKYIFFNCNISFFFPYKSSLNSFLLLASKQKFSSKPFALVLHLVTIYVWVLHHLSWGASESSAGMGGLWITEKNSDSLFWSWVGAEAGYEGSWMSQTTRQGLGEVQTTERWVVDPECL